MTDAPTDETIVDPTRDRTDDRTGDPTGDPAVAFARSDASIAAVAFDLDGLMFNTEAVFQRTLRELLAARGKPARPEMFAAMMGRRSVEANAIMIEMTGLTESIEEIQAEISARFAEVLEEILEPMPGMLDLLARLEAAGIPKAVCTSSSGRYCRGILRRYDLIERFDFLMAAEDVSRGKPDPEIYATAAARFGIAASSLLVLEDSEHGITSGKAAGAVAVAVPHEFANGQIYDHADLIADSLADPRLLALLRF